MPYATPADDDEEDGTEADELEEPEILTVIEEEG